MAKNTHITDKILPIEQLRLKVAQWRFKEQRIVFTNGCFDILHRGHIHTLMMAAEQGDRLIVGLNSDASVSQLKGPDRPIQDEMSRAILLAAMQFIDAVILFEEETPLQLIEQIKPDVLVKGGDYQKEDIVGAEILKKTGGEIITVPFLQGLSTTNIIKKAQI